MSGEMFYPSAMVHKCLSIYTWINIRPSQVENAFKGEAGSVYLTPCRAQQSVMEKLGLVFYQAQEEGKNGEGACWALTMSQTIGLGWKYTIIFDYLHNPGCCMHSNIGYWGSEKQNYVATWQSYFMVFPLPSGTTGVSGRFGSQLHHLRISLSNFFYHLWASFPLQ